jgi:orotate phosphoribosyltransferase
MMMQDKETVGRQVAAQLLKIGAIKLNIANAYTWSSGWRSPIYCDNRLSLSYPDIRKFIKLALCARIREEFPEVEAIAGVATAGIAQGALIAEEMGLPFLYVRSKPKGHGMENLIEGKVNENQKVVVIEDLISTGGSSLAVVRALREAKANVLGMGAIFTYGFPVADENFEKEATKLITLSNYGYLLEEAKSQAIIDESALISLQSWRKDPANWKPGN